MGLVSIIEPMRPKRYAGRVIVVLPERLVQVLKDYAQETAGDLIRQAFQSARQEWKGADENFKKLGWRTYWRLSLPQEDFEFYTSMSIFERLQFNKLLAEKLLHLLRKKLEQEIERNKKFLEALKEL